MSDTYLGIDLGGTKILAVLADANSKVVARAKDKTRYKEGPKEICTQIRELSDSLLSKSGLSLDKISGIGIAVPSSIDPESGDSLCSPALGWRNIPIKKTLEGVFGREVFLENDVNCGAYAEYRLGAGKGFENVVAYFVGTGLGGGIILNGKLLRGVRGVAGELGHEKIRFGGRKCGCGSRGCVEAYCSKTAFAKKLRKEIKKGRKTSLKLGDENSRLKSSALTEAFASGDELVLEIVNDGFRALGVAVANISTILAPQCIVIGGGVVESLGSSVMRPIEEAFEKNIFALARKDLELRLSLLGDDAVPLGAALNARALSKI